MARTLGLLIVIGLVALVVVVDMKRRAAEYQLEQLSIQMDKNGGGNQEQNKEAAQEVISKVRLLYALPEGVEPTVATIVDVNLLRERNAFYNKAKNGDHLIITNDRAILYDPIQNVIIDVVPVQIQPASQSSSSARGSTNQ